MEVEPVAARPRREKKSKVNTSALEDLANARRGGSKRVEQYQLEEVKSVFKTVDEDEYAAMVSKRRQDDFVEEDGDDLGYKDDGEEAWNRAGSSGDEYEENRGAAKKFGMVTVKEEVKVKPASQNRISMMLQKQAQKQGAKAPVSEAGLGAVGGADAESLPTKRKPDVQVAVDDLLGSLTSDTAKPKKKMAKKAPRAGARNAFLSPMDSKKRPSVPQRKKILGQGVHVKHEEGEDDMPAYDDVEMNDTGSDDFAQEQVKDEMQEDAAPARSGGFAPAPASEKPTGLQNIKAEDDWKSWRNEAMKMEDEEEKGEVPEVAADVVVGELGIPQEEDGSINMFWIDAYWDKERSGRLFIFGKIRTGEAKGKSTFSSVCVQVEGLQRQVYIQPREYILDAEGNATEHKVSLIDHVFPEFFQIAKSKGIKGHKCKPVTRNYMYHFQEKDVPATGEYLKCVYSAEYAPLDSALAGRSFKRIFGTNQSTLELFLLKRDLMGPCWINIKGAQGVAAPLSHCKHEFRVTDSKSVIKLSKQLESPPLSVMSIHMQTVKNAAEHANEIAMISALVHQEVSCEGPTDNPEKKLSSFTIARKLDGQAWPIDIQAKIEEHNKANPASPTSIQANERALLSYFLAKVSSIDPDVIVGHNFIGFDLDVLLHRMQKTKIPAWSKLGRLRRTQMPKLQANAGGMGQATWAEKTVTAGRLVCDTYINSKEHLRETTYTLTELARTQLGKKRPEIDPNMIPQYFGKTLDLLKLISLNENDTWLCMSLMFKLMLIPLTKQLTNLSGFLWSRSLVSQRAERVEYLLLHEFHRLKYVMPEKAAFKAKGAPQDDAGEGEDGEDGEGGPAAGKKWTKRKKAAYAGGLVLEPKRGLYDKHIMLLDFNSLYPTIIQEYNICFTTVQPPTPAEVEGEADRYEFPDKDGKPGVLPRVIKTLVDRRRTVKDLIKKERDPLKIKQYDIRQSALKIMANSMYGCLGFTFSRFYAKPLAEMITSQGRELLQRTVDVTQNKLNLEVVYGDTDSIFVNSGCDNFADATRVAHETRKELNKMWRLLEVGLDGIYCPLLLLNKKKYAAMALSERDGVLTRTKERKGLDIVRRDWCILAKRVGDTVLDFILSGDPVDEVVDRIHSFLRQTADDMENNRLQLKEFIITKGLTKEPEEYSDGKTQAHVQVALKMKQAGNPVRAGDHIPYVVTADPSVTSFAQRAFHPADVEKANGGIALDKKWYLESQLHPVISRICAVIEGTDAGQLAECLGLEASKFHKNDHQGSTTRISAFAQQAEESDRFANVEKLWGMCSDTLTREFKGPYVLDGSSVGRLVSGLTCPDAPGVRFNTRAIRLQVQHMVRNCLSRYHDGWMRCSDDTCAHRTRNIMCDVYRDGDVAEFGLKCPQAGCTGKMQVEYTSEQLYLQVLYLKQLFDIKIAERKLATENEQRAEQNLMAMAAPRLEDDDRVFLDVLYHDCADLLQESAYNIVDLGELFSFS